MEHYKTNEPRGEYVLVMAGAPETADPEQELTLEQAAQRALELTGQGFGPPPQPRRRHRAHLILKAKCTSSCWYCNRASRLVNDSISGKW